jgi:hypothetical protein
MRYVVSIFIGFLFGISLVSSHAEERYLSIDPRFAVQAVIALTSKKTLPEWGEPGFARKAAPFLTADFIAAIDYGARVAGDFNLYDGNLFTGAQSDGPVRLLGIEVSKLTAEHAIVDAWISTRDDPIVPAQYRDHVRYQLRRVVGLWKIDDFRHMNPDEDRSWVKELFKYPMRGRRLK